MSKVEGFLRNRTRQTFSFQVGHVKEWPPLKSPLLYLEAHKKRGPSRTIDFMGGSGGFFLSYAAVHWGTEKEKKTHK